MRLLRCLPVLAALAAACVCAADAPPAVLAEGTARMATNASWNVNYFTGLATVVFYERPAISSGKIVQARTTGSKPQEMWKPLVIARSAGAFAKGDVLLIAARARCTETTNAAGTGLFRTHFERVNTPKKAFSAAFRVPKAWTQVWLPFVLDRDIPDGQGALTFNLGYEMQTVELCDMQLYSFPQGFDISRLPKTEFEKLTP